MKNQKNILKIGLWISFMAFFALCITKNKGTAAFVAVAALAVTIAAIKFPVTKIRIKPYIRGYSVIIGVCINALLARNFYLVWHDSEKINSITQTVGISGRLCVEILTVLAVLVATPGIAWCIGVVIKKRNVWSAKVGFQLETKAFFTLCIVIAIVGIVIQIFGSFSMHIWGDEAFSLMMIRHGYLEMIELTAADVHPPLYYIILKACVDCVHLINDNIETVYLAKLVSVVPYALTLLLCVTAVRRRWGYYVAGVSAICLTGMPNLIDYGVEIRMYSWGLFFVTGAFLCFSDIMLQKSDFKKSWSGLVLYSIAAAYTHYFACVSVALLYLVLLLYFLFNQKENIKNWLAASGVTILAYMPWLIILVRQLKEVKENYWISAIDGDTLKSYVYYIWENNWLLAACLICVLLFVKTLFGKTDRIERKSAVVTITAFAIPVGTTVFGIVVSLIMRPVFVTRYMIPGLFCLWLGMSLMVLLTNNNIEKVVYAVIVFLIAIGQVREFVNIENFRCNQVAQAMKMISERSESIFLCDDAETQRVLLAAKNQKSYLLGDENSNTSLIYAVYGEENLPYISENSEIADLLREGKTVYLLSVKESSEQEIESAGLVRKKIGEYWFTQYMMGIYQIALPE